LKLIVFVLVMNVTSWSVLGLENSTLHDPITDRKT